jgi:lysophospholipase L1-like esterase
MGTDTRAASILVGAAMATAPARRAAAGALAALGRRADQVIAALAIGIGLSWVVVDGASSAALYRGGLLLHSAAAAVVVGALALAPTGRVANALSWRPLVWVGVRSYGLYLWHWPVYVVLSTERTGLDGMALTMLRVGVSAFLAAVSFRLVEDPIRRRVTWVRDRRGIPALAGAVAVVAATLIVLPQARSEIAAFDPSTIAAPAEPQAPTFGPVVPDPPAATTVPPTTMLRPTPSTRPPNSAADESRQRSTAAVGKVSPSEPVSSSTTTIAAIAKRQISSVLWTGDSIAYDLAPGVGAALTGAGLLAHSGAFPGMRLIDDGQFGLLPRLQAQLPGSGIDVVVVQLSVWDSDNASADQAAALDEVQAFVISIGAQLVLVSSPPTTDLVNDQGLVALTEHARALAAAQPESTVFLDSSGVWGAVFDADLDDDGTPERKRDGVHVCPSGAARFAFWLTAELTARYDGAVPTPPTEWATGSWVTDARYDEPVGSCAPLSE